MRRPVTLTKECMGFVSGISLLLLVLLVFDLSQAALEKAEQYHGDDHAYSQAGQYLLCKYLCAFMPSNYSAEMRGEHQCGDERDAPMTRG